MGIFSKWFSSHQEDEDKYPEVDLSILKTDIHSHLLPGIDDGAENMEESIALIKAMKELGYSKLIITPHVINDYFRNTPEIIESKFKELKNAVTEAQINIELEVAAEYLVDETLEDKIKNNEILSFGKEKYVLIEIPFFSPPHNLNRVVFDFIVNGYKVVLAHPERYLYWMKDLVKFEELKDRDVLFQCNLLSFTGFYSDKTKELLETLIDHQMIDFIGSDLHQIKYIGDTAEARSMPYLYRLIQSGKIRNATL